MRTFQVWWVNLKTFFTNVEACAERCHLNEIEIYYDWLYYSTRAHWKQVYQGRYVRHNLICHFWAAQNEMNKIVYRRTVNVGEFCSRRFLVYTSVKQTVVECLHVFTDCFKTLHQAVYWSWCSNKGRLCGDKENWFSGLRMTYSIVRFVFYKRGQ